MENPALGSSFQEFLEVEGLAEEVEALVLKRIAAWRREQLRQKEEEPEWGEPWGPDKD